MKVVKGNEKINFVICSPQGFFVDDVKTTCADCGRTLYHRPHTPKGTFLCIHCAGIRMQQQKDFDVAVTEETIKEVKDYIGG
jgi:hypothetical protein